MQAIFLAACAVTAVGVDVGWQQTDDGDVEYIIQVEPNQLKTLREGDVIEVGVRPEMRDVRRYRIVVGNDPLPREKLSPQLSISAAPVPAQSVLKNKDGGVASATVAKPVQDAGNQGYATPAESGAGPSGQADLQWPNAAGRYTDASEAAIVDPNRNPPLIEVPRTYSDARYGDAPGASNANGTQDILNARDNVSPGPALQVPETSSFPDASQPGRLSQPGLGPAAGASPPTFSDPRYGSPAPATPTTVPAIRDSQPAAANPYAGQPQASNPVSGGNAGLMPIRDANGFNSSDSQAGNYASRSSYDPAFTSPQTPVAANDPRQEGPVATKTSNGQTQNASSEDEESRPWGLFTVTLLALFGSLGVNLYLGWMTWDMRHRFRNLVYRLRYDDARPVTDTGLELR